MSRDHLPVSDIESVDQAREWYGDKFIIRSLQSNERYEKYIGYVSKEVTNRKIPLDYHEWAKKSGFMALIYSLLIKVLCKVMS